MLTLCHPRRCRGAFHQEETLDAAWDLRYDKKRCSNISAVTHERSLEIAWSLPCVVQSFPIQRPLNI